MVVVCLIAAGWFGRLAYLRITLEPTPRPEYWAEKIAALDPPPAGAVSEKEILSLLVDRPFESAFETAIRGKAPDYSDIQIVLEGAWDQRRLEITEATAAFETESFVSGRKRLIDAGDKGWRIAVPPTPEMLLPHLTEFRRWSKWIAAHSRWAREHNHDLQTSVDDWLCVLRNDRQLRRSKYLIDILVSIASDNLVARELMYCSRESKSPLDSRRLVEQVDQILEPVMGPQQILIGEKICLQSWLEHIYVRDGGDWLAVNKASYYNGKPFKDDLALPSTAWTLFSPFFHDLPTAEKSLARSFDSMLGCTDLCSCAAVSAHLERDQNLREGGALVGMPILSEWGYSPRSIMLYYRGRTELEAGFAMVAIRAFVARRGRLPLSLDELLPDFLPRLPIDYADRRPLRYAVEFDRFTLYSIGSDERDDRRDHGFWRTRVPPPPNWDTASDFVFTDVVRPKVRP